MNKLASCLLLSSAIALSGPVAAHPVMLTATLKNYGGDGAYLALYLTDANGDYVRTLWVAGKKSKYHKHLTDWYRAAGSDRTRIDGITGASVGAGRNLEVTVDLADALFDAGYALNLDAAAEDMPESPRDVSVPLTTSGAGKTVAGRRYVASFRYGP